MRTESFFPGTKRTEESLAAMEAFMYVSDAHSQDASSSIVESVIR